MRPVHLLLGILLLLAAINTGLYLSAAGTRRSQMANGPVMEIVVAGLGITDLCVATEARYTRHPAISDRTAPFMDHPGAIEHFPTGSFWYPPAMAH